MLAHPTPGPRRETKQGRIKQSGSPRVSCPGGAPRTSLQEPPPPLRCDLVPAPLPPRRPTPLARLPGQMHSPGWRAWPAQTTPPVHGCPPATTAAAPQIEPPPPPTPHCSREAAGCKRQGPGTEGCPTHPQPRTGARSTVGAPWRRPGRSWQVNALSRGPRFFQSPVHSRLAPGGGSSEGTSAPRPSSAGERVTSGSSPEPLWLEPTVLAPWRYHGDWAQCASPSREPSSSSSLAPYTCLHWEPPPALPPPLPRAAFLP